MSLVNKEQHLQFEFPALQTADVRPKQITDHLKLKCDTMILKRLISNLGRTPFTVQIKCQSYQASKRPFQFHPNFDPDWKAKFEESFEVFDHFVSEDEEKSLLNEVEPHLKRLVYEKDHWDNVRSLMTTSGV